ncbi:MAG: hypothetical protein WD066_09395 [Planctomycetaceae bacterium]
MRNFRWLIAAVVPVVALGLAAAPASAVVIDDFSDPAVTTVQNTYSVADDGPAPFTSSTLNTGTATAGGDRFMTMQVFNSTGAPAIPGSDNANNFVGGGTLGMSVGSNIDAATIVEYDGITSLFQQVDVEFTFLDNDMEVTLFLDDGTTSGSLTQTMLAANSPGTLTFLLNDPAFTGIDLNSLVNVQLTFGSEGSPAQDFQISQISTPDQEIPEPASLLVWGAMGLTGMVSARRRRKLNQK